MKKLLALLMVFLLVFSVVACSSDEPVAEETPEETPTETPAEEPAEPAEKIVNMIETSNIPALITWQTTDSVSFEILGNINSGLYTLGEGGVPVADLAESVDISADGLTYTFKLRDSSWSTVDGEVYAPVTANDFVFAWKKLLDPAEAAQYSFMITTASIVNGAEAVALNDSLVNYEKDVKDLEGLSEDSYEDEKDDDGNVTKTAKELFDAAKLALEESIAASEAAFTEEHGSVDEAYTALTALVDSLGVTAVDDKTLEVKLANPVPYFVDLMAFPSFFPASEAFYTEVGDNYGRDVESFLYNGAFLFKEWKISERHYLVKNENYWDAANVAIDGVDYRVIEEVNNDTTVQMYLDGEIMSTALSGENVEKYGNRPDAVSREDTVIYYVEINQGKGASTPNKELLANVDARKALNMTLDKTYITDVIMANGSLPADYLVPRGFQGSAAHDNKDFRAVAEDLYGGKEGYNGYDVEAGQALWASALAEAGMSEVELELIIYQSDTAAKVGAHLKNEWEKNLPGLTINVVALPFSEKLQRADNGDYELNWAGWGPDYPDAMTFVDMWVTGGGHNATGYANADYDAMIEECKSGELTDPAKVKERFETMVELEKIMLGDDQVIIPLYQRANLGLRSPSLTNWYPQTFGPDIIYKWVDIVE